MRNLTLPHFFIYLMVALSATNEYRSAVLGFKSRQRILESTHLGGGKTGPKSSSGIGATSEKRKMGGVSLTSGGRRQGRRLTSMKNQYQQISEFSSDEQLAPEIADGNETISTQSDEVQSSQMKDELENDDDVAKLKKMEAWTQIMKKHNLNEWHGQCQLVRTHLETLPDYNPVNIGWSQQMKSLIGKGRVDFVGKYPMTNRRIIMTLVEDVYEHKRHQIENKLRDIKKKMMEKILELEEALLLGTDQTLESLRKKLSEDLKENLIVDHNTIISKFPDTQIVADYIILAGNTDRYSTLLQMYIRLSQLDFSVDTDLVMRIAENPWINFDTENMNMYLLKSLVKDDQNLFRLDLTAGMKLFDEDLPVDINRIHQDQYTDVLNRTISTDIDLLPKYDTYKAPDEIQMNYKQMLGMEFETDLNRTRFSQPMHKRTTSLFDDESTDDSTQDLVFQELSSETDKPLANITVEIPVTYSHAPVDSEEFFDQGDSQKTSDEDALIKYLGIQGQQNDVSDLSSSKGSGDFRDGYRGIYTDEHGTVDMSRIHDIDEDQDITEALMQITSRTVSQKIEFVKSKLSNGLHWEQGGYDQVGSEETESLLGSQLRDVIDDFGSQSFESEGYDDFSKSPTFSVPTGVYQYLPESMKDLTQPDFHGTQYFRKYEEHTQHDRQMRLRLYPIYQRIKRKYKKHKLLSDPHYFKGKSQLLLGDEDSLRSPQVETIKLTESRRAKAVRVLRNIGHKISPPKLFKMRKRTRALKKIEKMLRAEFFHSNTNKDMEYLSYPEEAFKSRVFDLHAIKIYKVFFPEKDNSGLFGKFNKIKDLEEIYQENFEESLLSGTFAFGEGVFEKLPLLLSVSDNLLKVDVVDKLLNMSVETDSQPSLHSKTPDMGLSSNFESVVTVVSTHIDVHVSSVSHTPPHIQSPLTILIPKDDDDSLILTIPSHDTSKSDTMSLSQIPDLDVDGDIPVENLQMLVLQEQPLVVTTEKITRLEHFEDELHGHNEMESDGIRAHGGGSSIGVRRGQSLPVNPYSDLTPIVIMKNTNKRYKKLKKVLGFNNPVDDLVNFFADENDSYFMEELSPDREVMRFKQKQLKLKLNGVEDVYKHIVPDDFDFRRNDLGLREDMSDETTRELRNLMTQKYETKKNEMQLEPQGLDNKFDLFPNYGYEVSQEMSNSLISKLKDMKKRYFGEYLAESSTPERLENQEIEKKRDELQQWLLFDRNLTRQIETQEIKLSGDKISIEAIVKKLSNQKNGFLMRTMELDNLERQKSILEDDEHLETYEVGNLEDGTITDKVEAYLKLKLNSYIVRILERNLYLLGRMVQIKDNEKEKTDQKYGIASQAKAQAKNQLAAHKKNLLKMYKFKLKPVSKIRSGLNRLFGKRRQFELIDYNSEQDDTPFQQNMINELKETIKTTNQLVGQYRIEKQALADKLVELRKWKEGVTSVMSKLKTKMSKASKKAKETRKIMVSKYEEAIKRLEQHHKKDNDVKEYKTMFLQMQNNKLELKRRLRERKIAADRIRALQQYLSVRDPRNEKPEYEFIITEHEMEQIEKRYEVLGDFMYEQFFNNRENEQFIKEELVRSGYKSVKNMMDSNNLEFEKRSNYEMEMKSKIDFESLEKRGYPVPEQSWDTLDRIRTMTPPKKKKYPTFGEMFKAKMGQIQNDLKINIFNMTKSVLKYEDRPNLDQIRSDRYLWDAHKYHEDLNMFVSFPLSPLYQEPLLDIRQFPFGDFYWENFDNFEVAGKLRALNTQSGFGRDNLKQNRKQIYRDNMVDNSGEKLLEEIYQNLGKNFEMGNGVDFKEGKIKMPFNLMLKYYNHNNETYGETEFKFSSIEPLKSYADDPNPVKLVDPTFITTREIRPITVGSPDHDTSNATYQSGVEEMLAKVISSGHSQIGHDLFAEEFDDDVTKSVTDSNQTMVIQDTIEDIMDKDEEEIPTFINGKFNQKTEFDPNLLFMMSSNSMMWNTNYKSWAFMLADPKYRFPEHQNLVKYVASTLKSKIQTIYKESRERLELAHNIETLEKVVDIHGGFLLAQSYKRNRNKKIERCFLDTKLSYDIFTMIKTNVVLNETAFLESFLKTLYNMGLHKDAKAFMMVNYAMFSSPEYTADFGSKELPDSANFKEMGVAIERFSMHYSLMINTYKDMTGYRKDNEQLSKKKQVFVNLFYKIKKVLLAKIKEKFQKKMQEKKQNIGLVITEFITEFLVDALSFLDFIPFFETIVKKLVTLLVGKLMDLIIKKLKVPITKGVRKIREIFNKADNINMHGKFVNSLDFEKLVSNQMDYNILSQRTKFKVGSDTDVLETIFYTNAEDKDLLYNQMQNLYLFKPTDALVQEVFGVLNIVTDEVTPVTKWDGVNPLSKKYGANVDFRMNEFVDFSGNVYYKNLDQGEAGPSFLN